MEKSKKIIIIQEARNQTETSDGMPLLYLPLQWAPEIGRENPLFLAKFELRLRNPPFDLAGLPPEHTVESN